MQQRGAKRSLDMFLKAGVLIFCLSLSWGCSKPMTKTRVITLTPPAELMEETEVPKWQPRTNKELAKWAIERDIALQQCNADKASIAKYVARTSTETLTEEED